MVWGVVSAKETPKKTNEEKRLFQRRRNILCHNKNSYQNEHKSNNLKSLLMNTNCIISSGVQFFDDLKIIWLHLLWISQNGRPLIDYAEIAFIIILII